jgi:hypothetical protein
MDFIIFDTWIFFYQLMIIRLYYQIDTIELNFVWTIFFQKMSHTLMNTPTKANIENQMKINANKGLSSMSTNLDCVHYR